MFSRFGTLSESQLRILSSIAKDSIAKYDTSNHSKKIELQEIIRHTERSMPVESIDELRKRAEGVLFRLVPKSTFAKKTLILIGLLLISVPLLTIVPVDSIKTSLSKILRTDILVWKVGSPWDGGTPASTLSVDISSLATRLNYKLVVVGVPAEGFADRLHKAVEDGTEPEIIAIDNYGLIEGITSDKGRFDGIGDDASIAPRLISISEALSALNPQSRGWVFLLSGSRQYQKAYNLATAANNCSSTEVVSKGASVQTVRSKVTAVALESARQFTSCATVSAGASLTPSLRANTCEIGHGPVAVSSASVCSFAGNPQLAFVTIGVTFSGGKTVGRKNLLVGVTNDADNPKVLFVTDDSYSFDQFSVQQNSDLGRPFRDHLNALLDCQKNDQGAPLAATLITSDGFERRRPQQRTAFPTFEWTTSSSSNVAFEIVEFQIGGTKSRIFFQSGKPGARQTLSSGYLMSDRKPSQWRVLSVNTCGSLSLTPFRSYRDVW